MIRSGKDAVLAQEARRPAAWEIDKSGGSYGKDTDGGDTIL